MSPTTSTYLLSQENETNNGGLCLVGLYNGGVTYKLIFCSWDQMTHRHRVEYWSNYTTASDNCYQGMEFRLSCATLGFL